jgi:hypothetical protein
MVLSASGKRMTSTELAQHPVLNNLSTRAIGAHLRALMVNKQVMKYADKTWASKTSQAVVEQTKPKMYFVLNTTKRTLELNVGGLQFPVEVET